MQRNACTAHIIFKPMGGASTDYSSIEGLFASIDAVDISGRGSCPSGLLDKEKLTAWLAANPTAASTLALLQKEGPVRQLLRQENTITTKDFVAVFHDWQRRRLERYFLSLDIHKLLASAVPLQDSIDELTSIPPAATLLDHLKPSLDACVKKSRTMLDTDAAEDALRKTAQVALGVQKEAEEKLHGLQREYNKQLKERAENLRNQKSTTSLKKVFPFDIADGVCRTKSSHSITLRFNEELSQNYGNRPRTPDEMTEESCVARALGEDLLVGGLTGLIDDDQFLQLKKELWLAAGGSTTERKPHLIVNDPSTWTWKNLGEIENVQTLAGLQVFAGPHYVRRLQQPINLMKVTDICSNMMPLATYLHAQDKHDLTHAEGKHVKFNLHLAVFGRGNEFNSGETLVTLKKIICPEAQQVVELVSSPITSVTLPEAARTRAGIPPEAMFYCFCYPVLATFGGRSKSNGFEDQECSQERMARLEQLKNLEEPLDTSDPFVCLLFYGGFLYFDHTYDIVAVNSVTFDQVTGNTSAIYLGSSSPLPPMSIDPLKEGGRFIPLTGERIRRMGFTHFAWICPSEFVGDSIFTKSGGFAYINNDVSRSIFLPVVPKRFSHPDNHHYMRESPDRLKFLPPMELTVVPQPYEAPLSVPELLNSKFEQRASQMAEKFLSAPPELATFSAGQGSALGIKAILFVGKSDEEIERQILEKREKGVQAIIEEVEALNADCSEYKGADYNTCKWWLNYVVHEKAEVKEIPGNDGFWAVRDHGRNGETLDDFCKMEQAKIAQLTKAEVAALRLYTTILFLWINGPLRKRQTPHPLPFTTLCIYEGLKKLRAVHLSGSAHFQPMYLWRGMNNRSVGKDFLLHGGSEIGCMSTSQSLSVVAGYASSRCPLLFRIKVESPMDLGANISWVSVFPLEEEVLSPPLTFLKPMFEQTIMGSKEGSVITVKPSFPS